MKKFVVLILGFLTCVALSLVAYRIGKTFLPAEGTFNFDIFSLIVSNAIVIVLFGITYILIDKRNIEKDENQNEIVRIMLNEMFLECKKSIEVFTPQVIEKYVVPKVDFNASSKSDKVTTNMRNSNFIYDEIIFESAKNGIITKDDFSDYSKLKRLYSTYIEFAITFYDAQHLVEPEKKKVMEHIDYYEKKHRVALK